MDLTKLNQEYCQRIKEDKEAHALSAAEEIAYMSQSTAKYHGRCVSTLYMPKIFLKGLIVGSLSSSPTFQNAMP